MPHRSCIRYLDPKGIRQEAAAAFDALDPTVRLLVCTLVQIAVKRRAGHNIGRAVVRRVRLIGAHGRRPARVDIYFDTAPLILGHRTSGDYHEPLRAVAND